MNNFEKTMAMGLVAGLTGAGIMLGIVKLVDYGYYKSAKLAIDGVNECGKSSTNNEFLKATSNFVSEVTKSEIDNIQKRNNWGR